MPLADRIVLRSSPTEDTTPDMGMLLGHALAMDYKRIVVARDQMRSSSMMKEALVAGILSSGADVLDIGVASGPAAALAATKGDCAVYVTEYRGYGMISGYILLNRDGSLFRKEQIRHLEKIFVDPPELPPSGKLGHVIDLLGAVDEYNARLTSAVSGKSECAIILDCGCGPVSASAPVVLNDMGADVLTLNAQYDLDFKSEAMDETGVDITDTERLVGCNMGSIGICMNKIGTMMALLDEKGNRFTPEQLFATIVMYLRPSSIAVPIDISSLVIEAYDGKLGTLSDAPPTKHDAQGLVLTPNNIGSVCESMASGSELGYYDGGIIFGGTSMMPDGIRAAMVIAAIAGSHSLNRLAASFPDYRRDSREVECTCGPDAFVRAMEGAVEDMENPVLTAGEAWRVELEEGWYLISLTRGPNPTVRIDAESADRAYLIGLMEVAEDLVSDCMKSP